MEGEGKKKGRRRENSYFSRRMKTGKKRDNPSCLSIIEDLNRQKGQESERRGGGS